MLGAILIASLLSFSTARAASIADGRDEKKRIELMVVEKKAGERPARSNEPRRQRPPDRKR